MTTRFAIPWMSLAIAGVIVSVSVGAWMDLGLPLTAETAPHWGARDAWGLHLGENWRLLTAGLLHSNVAHLLLNLGPCLPILFLLERAFGGTVTLWLTIVCVVIGHASGALTQGGTSVGFSPALFGLIAAFAVTHWRRYPHLARLGLIYLCIGLIASMRFADVDLASHVGGIGAGVVSGLIWSQRQRVSDLMIIALLPFLVTYTLPQQSDGLWTLKRDGLQLTVHASLLPQSQPNKRCTSNHRACVTATTLRVSRLHELPAWSKQCASALGPISRSTCQTARPGAICKHIRRGLYQHSICLNASNARGLSAFPALISRIELTPPADFQSANNPINAALQAHRLGEVDRARALYRSAMEKAPLDAKLPFLAALLEIDFADDLLAAEKLALRATKLDAIHPDGKALIDEIRVRLAP